MPLKRKEAFSSPLLKNSESGYFTCGDGTTLYYEDTGRKTQLDPKPTLFFLYGLGCSIYHWKYQIEHFTQKSTQSGGSKYRVLWLDYRNHGRSPHNPHQPPPHQQHRLTLDQIAHDIIEFCQSKKVENAVFLGQSMGGTLGLKIAKHRPQLVSKLVLQGSPILGPSETLQFGLPGFIAWKSLLKINHIEFLRDRFGSLYRNVTRGLKWPMKELIYIQGFNPRLSKREDMEEYVEKLLSQCPNCFYDLATDLERMRLHDILPPQPPPALILAGDQDNVIPLSYNKWLHGILDKSVLSVIQNGSHCPHLDRPEEVNNAIEAFLKR